MGKKPTGSVPAMNTSGFFSGHVSGGGHAGLRIYGDGDIPSGASNGLALAYCR